MHHSHSIVNLKLRNPETGQRKWREFYFSSVIGTQIYELFKIFFVINFV